jgi:predicted acetyltransferase
MLDVVESASGEEVADEAWPYFERVLEPERAFGVYDGSTIVGGGAIYSYQLTIPGGRIGAAGVTAVGVQPSHRRRGALRMMMAEMLADARARGEAAAILWASESSIYGRFGYGLAALNGRIEIERDKAALLSQEPARGSFRLIDESEALALFPPIYDAVAAQTPGFFSRSRDWWEGDVLPDLKAFRRGAGKKFYVVHERDGAAVAYLMYRVSGDWGDTGSLSVVQVQEALALDADALRDLWRFIFGIDLVHKIRTRAGPADHPLLLMTVEPRRLALRVGDGLWLRIVDVQKALAERSFAADGSLTFELRDDFLPDLAGRWRIDASAGRATVTRTDAPADLELDTADLACTLLGAFSFTQLARAGRVRATAADALERADAMFRTPIQPWCPQVF